MVLRVFLGEGGGINEKQFYFHYSSLPLQDSANKVYLSNSQVSHLLFLVLSQQNYTQLKNSYFSL